MSDMPTTTLSVAVGPRTGKIIKNGLRVFERSVFLKEEKMLQNGIYT